MNISREEQRELHVLAQGGGLVRHKRGENGRILQFECFTRDGHVLANCTLEVFQRTPSQAADRTPVVQFLPDLGDRPPDHAVASRQPLIAKEKSMDIRSEQHEDIEAIRHITKAAFAPIEHSSQTEATIVDALRNAGALTVSIVAVTDGEVVGHVAFSPVAIDGQDRRWYGLGPVSVRPDRQKEGIGGKLIREGLARLAQAGARGCVVLGDPGYYKRFGFENDPGLRFEEAPAEYFMRLAFERPAPSGRVAYHDGFNAT